MPLNVPLCIRLRGGLRADPYELPLKPLEALFGIKLRLSDDYDYGGVHYRYSPEPVPDVGPVTILVHPNAVSDDELTYPTRPDLDTALRVDLFGATLLDPGRLEWSLRGSYGDLYDVAEYSAFSLRPSEGSSPNAHWVEFAGVPGGRGVPLPDTPVLACGLDAEVPASRAEAVRGAVAGLTDAAAVLKSADLAPGGSGTRLALRFETPSLLELGRYAEVIVLAGGDETRLIGYSVEGDVQRDGRRQRVQHVFEGAEGTRPVWRAKPARA
jgi:hypothetical protein